MDLHGLPSSSQNRPVSSMIFSATSINSWGISQLATLLDGISLRQCQMFSLTTGQNDGSFWSSTLSGRKQSQKPPPWCVRMLLLWEGNLMIIESRSETCMHVLINNVIYIYIVYRIMQFLKCSHGMVWYIYIKMVSQGTWSLDVPHLLKLKGNGWLRTGIPHDWNRQDASLINSRQFYYHGFTKSL